ncbi:growth-regulating factor 2-like [Apium graveolens]|uniref:growth-regulating factor 2-like n=1 Tax=Apium graveolens TaxID=4045 RepID=UPI003D7A4230
MDLGLMSFNGYNEDGNASSSRSVLQRSTHSLLANDNGPPSFSISFTNPIPAANYQDFSRQGYGCGGSPGGMDGPFTRCREPFTPSQWLDLELQALIYKYIVANVPVPSHLLFQIRKSLNPFLYAGSLAGSYAPKSFGWGTFHLGLSGSNDPEPGRCRRTDGKKWRCAREAVPDQKYCERHINRGRHRSRKPVESRKGQAVSGTTNITEVAVASSSETVMPGSGTSKSLSIMQHQTKSLQSATANPYSNVVLSRVQGMQSQSILSPTMDLKSKDSLPSLGQQHVRAEGSSLQEFGLVSSTSLLYSSDKCSYNDPRNHDVFLNFNEQETQNQLPLHRFMDDWPKNRSDHLTIGCPDEFKSDWTQLSMSIPKNSSTFSSCSNSPREKFSLMPLSIPSELDTVNMNLAFRNDPSEKQTSWNPLTWENSMGGPLGEALNSTSNSVEDSSRSSLMHNLRNSEVWDGHSQLGSSPTGVLQKTTFVSVSNSSAGSSPRAGNKIGGSSLPDDIPCSIPSS